MNEQRKQVREALQAKPTVVADTYSEVEALIADLVLFGETKEQIIERLNLAKGKVGRPKGSKSRSKQKTVEQAA